MNPQEYGFTMESQCLVPKKCYRNLPHEESLKCNCVKCATRSCPCTETSAAAHSVNARQAVRHYFDKVSVVHIHTQSKSKK